MKKSWIGLEGSFVLLLAATVMAHAGDGGGFSGICDQGTICHEFVDAFGHGMFGTGWIGFILVFGLWTLGAFVFIRYLISKLEVEIQELEQEYE